MDFQTDIGAGVERMTTYTYGKDEGIYHVVTSCGVDDLLIAVYESMKTVCTQAK